MTDSIGDTFIGPVTLDVDGITCVQWKDLEVQNELMKLGVKDSDFQDHTLEEAQNYCRNPNVDPNGPWCYVRQEGRLTKKTCSVLYCGIYVYRLNVCFHPWLSKVSLERLQKIVSERSQKIN